MYISFTPLAHVSNLGVQFTEERQFRMCSNLHKGCKSLLRHNHSEIMGATYADVESSAKSPFQTIRLSWSSDNGECSDNEKHGS
jgi:hypothetical protein